MRVAAFATFVLKAIVETIGKQATAFKAKFFKFTIFPQKSNLKCNKSKNIKLEIYLFSRTITVD